MTLDNALKHLRMVSISAAPMVDGLWIESTGVLPYQYGPTTPAWSPEVDGSAVLKAVRKHLTALSVELTA